MLVHMPKLLPNTFVLAKAIHFNRGINHRSFSFGGKSILFIQIFKAMCS